MRQKVQRKMEFKAKYERYDSFHKRYIKTTYAIYLTECTRERFHLHVMLDLETLLDEYFTELTEAMDEMLRWIQHTAGHASGVTWSDRAVLSILERGSRDDDLPT